MENHNFGTLLWRPDDGAHISINMKWFPKVKLPTFY